MRIPIVCLNHWKSQLLVSVFLIGSLFCSVGQADPGTPGHRATSPASSTSATEDVRAASQSKSANDGFRGGVRVGIGPTFTLGECWSEDNIKRDYGPKAKKTPALSLALGLVLDYYFAAHWAVTTGLGMVVKGTRIADFEVDGTSFDSVTHNLFYLSVPVGVKWTYAHFRAGLSLAMYIAVAGRSLVTVDRASDSLRWQDDVWDYYRRLNLGPELYLGYEVVSNPIMRIEVGVTWSMHLLSDGKSPSKEDDSDDTQSRFMNLLLDMSAYFY